ncbi:MAG: pirin-like C-terminal cupin domain-containing protein, partial [Actinomycetota bacterium]
TQNMRAGRGIRHGGDMAADPDTHVFHEVQLWVTTPRRHKMDPPAINTAHAGDKPVVEQDGVVVEVITGAFVGHESPLSTTQPTRVLRVTSPDGGDLVIDDIDETWSAALYVLRGAVVTSGHRATEYQTVVLGPGADLALTIEPGAELLIMTAEPTDEPIAMGGPWVMNTREELLQADRDFEAGLF